MRAVTLPRLRSLLLLSALLVAILFAAPAGAEPSGEGTIRYYRSRYGTVERGTDPVVDQTFLIFEQLRAIAGSIPAARLEVNASSGPPWSLVLPDGHVLLSRGAVQRCYLGAGREEGDARVAFILGHELAHLANNDFWHQESFLRMVGQQEDPVLLASLAGASDLLLTTPAAAEGEQRRCLAIPDPEGQHHCLAGLEAGRQTALAARRGKELAADDQGFLYAAMAGFQVDRLLASPTERGDFLSFWVRQTGAGERVTHPAAEERTALLRNRLQVVAQKVELFRFGVRHAAFGRHEAAISFFDQFRQLFPSREVLNNLGFCYLAKALAAMPQEKAYRYWLPLELGLATRLDTLVVRGGAGEAAATGLAPAVRADLGQAVHLFQAARERDETYLPARINLAAAHFLQGEIFESRAAVEHALRLDPHNPELQGFKALIQAKEDPGLTLAAAIRQLRAMNNRADCPAAVRFNLARLLEEERESPAAMLIWRDLADHGQGLPPLFHRQVLRAVGGGDQGAAVAGPALPWPLPAGVTLGQDLVAPSLVATLFPQPRWLASGFSQAGPLSPAGETLANSGRIFTHQEGDMVLTVDDFVEMVVLKGGKLGTAQGLLARCGPPLQRRTLAEGVLWSYGPAWMALVKEEAVKEVWVARLQ